VSTEARCFRQGAECAKDDAALLETVARGEWGHSGLPQPQPRAALYPRPMIPSNVGGKLVPWTAATMRSPHPAAVGDFGIMFMRSDSEHGTTRPVAVTDEMA
jgi:hypothetical protein